MEDGTLIPASHPNCLRADGPLPVARKAFAGKFPRYGKTLGLHTHLPYKNGLLDNPLFRLSASFRPA